MPDPQIPAPAAPAQPEPSTQSAVHAAVAAGDVSAYRTARRAERLGTPLATPVAPAPAPVVEPVDDHAEPVPPAAPASPESRQLSKRQQQINDYERRIAEQEQRIRALESSRAPQPARPEPAAPAPPAEPEWKRYASRPDAPKEADFDSFADFTAAMGLYIADQRYADREAQAQAQSQHEQLTVAQHARVERFVGQLEQAKTADPEFAAKLTPEVRALRPFGALQPGEAGGPLNVVAEQIYDSPIAPQVLLHFSQHPEALQQFVTVPPSIAALPPAQRARAHIQWIVKAFGTLEGSLATPAAAPAPKPKTLSDAPAPAHVLGSRPAEATDPKASAIRSGNTRAYREMRRQERAAGRR